MRIMGITRIRKWLAGIASAVVILLVVALPVLAYTYAGTAVVTVTESAGTTYANLPITMTVNNSYMATNGFMQSNGLDAAVVGTGGIALPTMIDSTQTLFVAPVTKRTQNGFNFTTGNTPVTSMPIIVGNGGYVTTADNAALEPANNFSIVASGYLNTTAGASENIVSKTGALSVYVDPSVSGTIDTSVNGNTSNVVQQFSTTTNSGVQEIAGTYWGYQTFTATAGTINGLGIYVYSVAGSQSTTTFMLYATSAGLPTGSALTSGTIASVTASAWNTVSCSYTLAGGTVYAIVVKMPAGTYGANDFVWSSTAGSGSGSSNNSGSTYAPYAYTCSYETLAPLPQITGVSSGVGTLSLSETTTAGGTLTLSWTPSGGSANTSTITNAGSVADTANNWIIDQNNVMPYMTSYTYTVGGTEEIKYQPNTIVITTALVNLDSAGAYPGVITFGSNPAGIAVAIGPLTTVSSGSSVSGGSSGSSSYAPASSGSQTNAEQLPALNAITFPLEPVVHGLATIATASNPSNEPATELMMVRIFAGIIVVGGAIGSLFLIRGHLFIAGVAGLVLMGIWIAWHVYPLASISIAVIFLIGTLLADRGGSD